MSTKNEQKIHKITKKSKGERRIIVGFLEITWYRRIRAKFLNVLVNFPNT
jgi:hypothetical protein